MRQKVRKRLFRPDRGQKQEVKPGQRAYRHARDRAPRSPATPEEPAEKGRRDLRHRRERQEADRHEARFAGHALVGEAQRQNADDGDPAHPQHQRADVAFSGERRRAAPEQERHHQVVGNGDGEGDALDHNHSGRRGEAAHHRQERHAMRAGVERQRENGQVAIERRVRENLEAGDGEGRNEQIDQHEIGGKEPGRGADVPLVVVLDHGDVELARQKHDRERRQQRGHHPDRGIGRRLDHRGDPGIGPGDLGQIADPVVEPPDDEGANGEKRHQLDDQFDRDGENETVLMLLGVDAPGAERHREDGEQQRHREIERGRGRRRRQSPVIERIRPPSIWLARPP